MIVLKFRVYLKNFNLKYLDNAFHKGSSFFNRGLKRILSLAFLIFIFAP